MRTKEETGFAAVLSAGETQPLRGIQDPQLRDDLEQVRERSLTMVSTAAPLIREAAGSLIGNSGKMLRPALVILAARYGHYDPEKILDLAAAVEMLHNATLVHDDIIDEAPLRRGNPALHAVYGNSKAVMMGDYLLSCSFTLAARSTSGTNGLALAHAVARICEGEVNQNAGRFGEDFSLRNYLRRIASKTAALFALSLAAGAREARVDETICSVFTRIGYNVGMAFQIIDDVLDYTGDQEKTGKPLGRDLLEGIYTLPLLLALKAEGCDGDLFRRVGAKPYSEEEAAEIVSLVTRSGAIGKARIMARAYTDRAFRELERLDSGYTRLILTDMIRQLLIRDR
jgi:heptaprenyl diphosphate synthase